MNFAATFSRKSRVYASNYRIYLFCAIFQSQINVDKYIIKYGSFASALPTGTQATAAAAAAE